MIFSWEKFAICHLTCLELIGLNSKNIAEAQSGTDIIMILHVTRQALTMFVGWPLDFRVLLT